MDDFGTMPGEGQMQGGPRQQDVQDFETQVMQPIPEVRGLLVNRLNLIGDENLMILDQSLTPQLGEVLKMILPEIADIIDQVAMAGSAKAPAAATTAQPPVPGHGQMARGGMGPIQGAAEEYEEEAASASPMPMGQMQMGGQMPQRGMAPSPLSRIRG